MYYEYWGLHKPAFDNVPDPTMYVDCHASMENAIAETLFAIEEGNECIAVIVGDVGLGKTMSIRMIIDTLDQEKYKMALITNPGVTFAQILQEIIGQLTGKQCQEKRKVQLLEIFNRLLFSTLAEGKKVLIFVDEANAISPANLENLRLMTNMQGDGRNLFTIVLAGQIEFAKRLEQPSRANLFQRIGTYCRIDRLESVEKVQQYVETRLRLAGGTKKIFIDDAFVKLYEQSDRGVPRLVNKLSKLCLKAGETNGFEAITGEMVEQIGSCFHKLSGPASPKRRSRKPLPQENLAEGKDALDHLEVIETLVAQERELDRREPVRQEPAYEEDIEEMQAEQQEEAEEAVVDPPISLQVQESAEEELSAPAAVESVSLAPEEAPPAEPEATQLDSEAEMCIGQVKIKIQIPEQLLKQSLSASHEHCYKLAGGLAAETLKKYPDLMSSLSSDPVPVWMEIRDFVMTRLTHAGAGRM
ncbi:MAG: AAA family ATPase [Deltaproteobacteria bacterium]|nr:AAA family ATPase [Deltaproteobacteria bacterium]